MSENNVTTYTDRQKACSDVPVELQGVSEALNGGAGFWRTCTGCYESEDGHPVGDYPYSENLGCDLGAGCSECGGIGAVWDDADYDAMAAAGDADEIAREQFESTSPITGFSAATQLAYVFLAPGDVIRATDERYSVTYHRWKAIAPLYVGTTVDGSTRPVRRAAGKDSVDAARYRCLRNPDPQPCRELDVCDDEFRVYDGDELDSRIDAAIASLTKTADGEKDA
jgi:hypothetical protein